MALSKWRTDRVKAAAQLPAQEFACLLEQTEQENTAFEPVRCQVEASWACSELCEQSWSRCYQSHFAKPDKLLTADVECRWCPWGGFKPITNHVINILTVESTDKKNLVSLNCLHVLGLNMIWNGGQWFHNTFQYVSMILERLLRTAIPVDIVVWINIM